ncbi:MAG TPA: hypothetical protein VF690_07935 [Hymenobacter sp.]|jgi:hypothetical protein
MNYTRIILFVLLGAGLGAASPAQAQDMPSGKGPVVMVEIGQGFNHAPGGDALYLGTLQVAPQWTVWPGRLRLGPVLGLFYPGTQVGGLAGGRATLKVINGPQFALAGTFHVHLLGEYLPLVWTSPNTRRQLLGTGLGLETSNLLGFTIKAHRDFRAARTYGQFTMAFNLRYQRFTPPKDL